ncbi:MAG: UDP-N-acetylmuramoyl-tripeptide--D-alanyl-D-alanine ligase [Acidimicrobiia bacterium]|nr:UDP-N-acetylmuramoyl-tripeptide--D-alanyl-D-alanine ligase [Acidimicrobiia bacterium]
MEFRADEVAQIVGGELQGPDVAVSSVVHDSREAAPGALFVPVVAERDGHDFVPDALAAGAAAYLTARSPVGGSAICCDDTYEALLRLARAGRDRLDATVIGITGSVGKTSVKDLAASVLAEELRTSASVRSFNNELGVPLTICNAPADTEALVVEMGMRGYGHIAELCELARPSVGVVTAVAMVHTELVDGLEGVARAKGELVEALPADGRAVLNAADRRVAAMATLTSAAVVRYGPGGHVAAEDVVLDDELRPRFRLVSDWGTTDVALEVRGDHQVSNALAAAAVGLSSGVSLEATAAGLGRAALSPWRMEVRRTAAGAVVVNDAYNAGPASMAAALRSLAAVPARRRVAVLGTMAELGEAAESAHREIGELATSLGIEVITVAEPRYGVGRGVDDVDGALAALGAVGAGDAVLVKGSRVVGLERVAAALLDGG